MGSSWGRNLSFMEVRMPCGERSRKVTIGAVMLKDLRHGHCRMPRGIDQIWHCCCMGTLVIWRRGLTAKHQPAPVTGGTIHRSKPRSCLSRASFEGPLCAVKWKLQIGVLTMAPYMLPYERLRAAAFPKHCLPSKLTLSLLTHRTFLTLFHRLLPTLLPSA